MPRLHGCGGKGRSTSIVWRGRGSSSRSPSSSCGGRKRSSSTSCGGNEKSPSTRHCLQELWRTTEPPGHPDRQERSNLSPKDLGPSPLNVGSVWHLGGRSSSTISSPGCWSKKSFLSTERGTKSHPVKVVGAEKGLTAQVLGADLGPYRCPTLQD